MFSCTIEGNSHPFALVLPLGTRLAVTRKDRLLHLYHLHAKPRKQAEFISAHSIVRGILLAPDFNTVGEYFIVNIADTDVSLRLKSIFPDCFS
jgi:hypothetical protein